jgi:cytochrome c556
MKSWIVVLVVALIPVGAVAVGAFQDDEKTPDTETIMKGLFSKKAGKFGTVLKKQVAASPVEWEEVQKTTEDIAKYGKALGKNEPEKGSKESWKKLTDKFAENTKKLDEAADAKDLDKVKDAQKAIGGSCKSCHDVHKGQ